jgi:cation/acetate symporter
MRLGPVSWIALSLLTAAPGAAWAQAAASRPSANPFAIAIFLTFVGFTLLVTVWAARRKATRQQFYTGGGGIGALQNGLAIAGDYMSASSFLGISSMIYMSGYDGLFYIVGTIAGWPIVIFLVAERLRNLGRFNVSDVVSYRLDRVPIRIVSSVGALAVIAIYLAAQMVGAGQLVTLLFGLPYSYAVVIVGLLMIVYVSFGGMLATTWVQMVKAVLLLLGASYIGIAVLLHFGFSLDRLMASAVEAHPAHAAILWPSHLSKDPVSAISVGIALIFGTAGLPHIMMRFFTVASAKAARRSVFFASAIMGYFYLILIVIGFGAIALVSTQPKYLDAAGHLRGGGNMAAVLLANAVGGEVVMGFISAVTFATILAVVSGLVLSAATAVSHDLYANVFRYGRVNDREEVIVSKIASVVIGLIAIGFGLAAQKQNITFLGTIAFAVAASTTLPPLILSLYWRGLTTRGAVVGSALGLVSSVGLTILSPAVWVAMLGQAKAIFPYDGPALFSMPLAFFAAWLVSVLDRSPAAEASKGRFDEQYVRSETGYGASAATPGHP